MSKELHFVVIVKEDGTFDFDSGVSINFNEGEIWDIEKGEWSHATDEDNQEIYQKALLTLKEKLRSNTMNKNTIVIEGQDNNVSAVLESLIANNSKFMGKYNQTYIGADMYGLTDNERWFGVEIYTEGDLLTNPKLDDFRIEFPNVDAEVKA